MSAPPTNTFLTAPLGVTYANTAAPIIFVMGMSGLLSVADALFLGHYVGPEALAAVTLIFPAFMLIIALSSLVSSGMSSILAQLLGGGQIDEARRGFVGAHGLALLVSCVLIALYFGFGRQAALLAAGGSETLAKMALTYLRITVLFSPILFVLAVNSDTLRNEGWVGFMAAMSLLVSVANIGFNYVLIGVFDMGVAGSAYGTTLAQLLGLVIIVVFRLRGNTQLRLSALLEHSLTHAWGRILKLGAPQSFNFVGLSLGSAAIMTALQMVSSQSCETTVSAYGFITRIMTFAYLPLLGLSFAMQTITGNNFGAKQWQRAKASLLVSLVMSLIYCIIIQILFVRYAAQIGGMFVDDQQVVGETLRIFSVVMSVFFLPGPLMIIGSYFQAIGDAGRAVILGLSKTYLFAIPLTFVLANAWGEGGIWGVGPLSEAVLLLLTAVSLFANARQWGLFHMGAEGRA